MIIDITRQSVDTKKLDKQIATYRSSIAEDRVDYLIMSDSTAYDLRNAEGAEYHPCKMELASYKGIRVAICNELDFGKVEVI